MAYTIYNVVMFLFRLAELLLTVYVAMTWIMPGQNFTRKLGKIFAPITEPARKLEFKLFPRCPLDFSPIVVILVLDLLRSLFSSIWYRLFF